MGGVLHGFITLASVIGLGFLIAHLKLVGDTAHRVLSRLAFFVASPALMLTVLAHTDIRQVFSPTLVASLIAIAATAVVSLLMLRCVFKRRVSETVIGMFGSVYVNAGNLGIPIATYVLGSASWIAPILMLQMIVLAPIGLVVLDLAADGENRADDTSSGQDVSGAPTHRARSGGRSGGSRYLAIRLATQPLRNPMLIGAVTGMVLSAFQIRLGSWVGDPLELIANMAVPLMLIAYGISLRVGPLPGRGEPVNQVGFIVAAKLLIQPLIGFVVARYLLGLDPDTVLAVTVLAALPSAQNVFNFAMRFDRGVVLARDAIFISTVAAFPVLVAIVALLSP